MATLHTILTDPELYAKAFLKVKHRQGGILTPFIPKPIQSKIFAPIRDPTRTKPLYLLILKSRRLGCSTGIAAEFLFNIMRTPHLRGNVVAHTGGDSSKLFSIYERFYDNIPAQYMGLPIKPRRAGGRGKLLSFREIDSELEVSAATLEPRGADAQLLHLSEAAYYPDPERYLGALMPQFPHTGRGVVILESTSDGPGGFYYHQWNAAINGESSFVPMFFGWYEDPDFVMDYEIPEEEYDDEEKELAERFGVNGFQIAWLRHTTDTTCFGNIKRRRIEYPSTPEEAFMNIEGTVWEPDDINGVMETRDAVFEGIITDRGIKRVAGGSLTIWEYPRDESHWKYVIGADPAGGFEDGDWSVASVWKSHKQGWPEQVAELSIKEDPVTFAYTLTLLGHYYKKALLAAEVTGLGRGTQGALQKVYFYPRLHQWIPWDKYRSSCDTWGWETTWRSKQCMIGIMDWCVRTKRIKIRSRELAGELMFFRQTGDEQYEGVRGDDRIMAAMIALCSWFQHQFPGVALTELRARLATAFGGSAKGARPSGGIDGEEIPFNDNETGEDRYVAMLRRNNEHDRVRNAGNDTW